MPTALPSELEGFTIRLLEEEDFNRGKKGARDEVKFLKTFFLFRLHGMLVGAHNSR